MLNKSVIVLFYFREKISSRTIEAQSAIAISVERASTITDSLSLDFRHSKLDVYLEEWEISTFFVQIN